MCSNAKRTKCMILLIMITSLMIMTACATNPDLTYVEFEEGK